MRTREAGVELARKVDMSVELVREAWSGSEGRVSEERRKPNAPLQRRLIKPFSATLQALDCVRSVKVPLHLPIRRVLLDLATTRPASVLESGDEGRREGVGGDEGGRKSRESSGGSRDGRRRGGDGGEREGGRKARGGEEGLDEGEGDRGVRLLVSSGESYERKKLSKRSDDNERKVRTQLDVLQLRVLGNNGKGGSAKFLRSRLENVETVGLLNRQSGCAGLKRDERSVNIAC